MSTRLVTPPPVTKWPFILGDVALLTLALSILVSADRPLSAGTLILVSIFVLVGVGVLLAPFLLDYEARLRVAEASARDAGDSQLKKISLLSEQLQNAVSRSQATEEEIGKALGATEEIVEKLTEQSEELGQYILRGNSSGTPDTRKDISAAREVLERRLEKLEKSMATLTRQIGEASNKGPAPEPIPEDLVQRIEESVAAVARIETALNVLRTDFNVAREQTPSASTRDARPKTTKSSTPPPSRKQDHEPDKPEKTPVPPEAVTQTADKAEPEDTVEADNAPDLFGLGLEDVPSEQPARLSKKDQANLTALAATAYIGIGNKLYLRGDGPGLTWNKGVPMQFLAIGKWGWSTAEAADRFSCQIFKNDEEPAIDGKITLTPREKKEISPRFP